MTDDTRNPMDERPHGAGQPDGSSSEAARGAEWRARLGSSEPGDLQLPPHAELKRHPVEDPDCRAVRLRLRDFVDSDLGGDVRAAIEEHVHQCRDCALSLSRVELEAVRLRRALADERRELEQGAPVDFTAGVMRSVGDLVLQDTGGAAAPSNPNRQPHGRRNRKSDLDAPRDFTEGVMQRVRREYDSRSSWRFRDARQRSWRTSARRVAGVLAIAVPVAAAAFVAARLLSPGAESAAGAEVVLARGVQRFAVAAESASDRSRQSVANGDRIDEASVVRVEPAGELQLRWTEADSEFGPPKLAAAVSAHVALHGPAIAELDAMPGLLLREGDVQWQLAPGGASLPLRLRGLAEVAVAGPASDVALDDGAVAAAEGWVSLERVLREDGAGAGGATGWRARVEVIRGQVEIRRHGEAVTVRGGHVARFDAVGAMQLEPVATSALLAASRNGVTRDLTAPAIANVDGGATAPGWRFRGRVVRADDNRPVAGAEVHVVLPNGAGSRDVLRTGRDGYFTLGLDQDPGDGAVALVEVVPPQVGASTPSARGSQSNGTQSRVGELTGMRPRAVALNAPALEPGRGVRAAGELGEFQLAVDVPVGGRVFDALGALVAGAVVTPVVVDELFGVVERLETASVRSDDEGRFLVRGLPAALGRRETLGLLVELDDLPRRIELLAGDVNLRRTTGELRIELPGERSWRVAGWQPGQRGVVLEAVPGVAVNCLAVVHDGVAEADGSLVVEGRTAGALYRFDPATGEAMPVRGVAVTGERSAVAAVAAVQVGGELRERGGPLRVSAAGTRVASAPTTSRWDRLHALDSRDLQWLSLHDPRRPALPTTRLFVQYADGSIAFVGEISGPGSQPFTLPAQRPFRLLAVGSDGSFGVVEVAGETAGLPAITLSEPGSIDLGAVVDVAAGGEHGLCRFEPLDGQLAGRSFWRSLGGAGGHVADGLPVGRYLVTLPDGRAVECAVAAGQRVTPGPTAVVDASAVDPAEERR